MTTPEAHILYCDESLVVVLCPFCDMVHKHSVGVPAATEWDYRSSHCRKGDYKFGKVLTGADLKTCIKSRENAIQSKREYRKKQKDTIVT
jgi:hypothetical protein